VAPGRNMATQPARPPLLNAGPPAKQTPNQSVAVGPPPSTAPSQNASFLLKLAHRWGLTCHHAMDVGALDCSFQPTRFDEVAKEASCMGPADGEGGGGSIVDQIGCHNAVPEAPVCCVPERFPEPDPLYAPCMVCAMRAATIVEVPCGHVNVCGECHRDYHTNTRCIRCRGRVPMRIDLAPFLDELTGRPDQCRMCKDALASVVMIPCVHMSFCQRCLPKSLLGCPTCGERVEQMCNVLWSTAAAVISHRATAFPRLPASAGALASHRGRDGLAKATEDVDEEIARLEVQLRQLRSMSPSGSSMERPPNFQPSHRQTPQGRKLSPEFGASQHPSSSAVPPLVNATAPPFEPPIKNSPSAARGIMGSSAGGSSRFSERPQQWR